ncbi:MAG: hypothetical protein IME96_13310, partial [Proteobacteria bacterium]|nr:hypothetical protein [Pseudomonadota bacterium]
NKFNTSQSLSFHIDASVKKKLEGDNYHSSIKDDRINLFNLEYTNPSEQVYMSVGRLWPKELSLERVDGINLAYKRNSFGIGFFGGLKPDPYTEEVNSDYKTGGLYFFYKDKALSANLAAVNNNFKGETDRQYLYGSLSYFPIGKVRFYSSVTLDLDQETDDIELTNGLLEFTFRPDFKKSITVGYNQFQAYQLFESMDYKIDRGHHQSYYVRGSYLIRDRYTLYGRYQLQNLHYDSNQLDTEKSHLYQIGMRNNKLFGSDINLDINSVISDRESSKYSTYSMEISKFFKEKFQLVLNGSSLRTEFKKFDETDDNITYSAAGYLNFNKNWILSLYFEKVKAENYTTDSMISRITYKF